MAQLSLRERLQPALLDRLIDDERMLTVFEFVWLEDVGIPERDLVGILASLGLREVEDEKPSIAGRLGEGSGVGRLKMVAPAGHVSLAHLKNLVLKPPGNPKGVALQTFCEITARNVLNDTAESGDLKSVSMRRLREYVCRDLGALLNCASLDAVVDLTAYPHVQSSVLNFGMPSLAGRTARLVDPQKIAQTIEAAIRRFEPRLSAVSVTPEMGEDGNETHVLAFRIEAQLWGQPLPQQLVLRTSIDVDSGAAKVSEAGVS
jgi:type VI secretion system protein ImpF